MLGTPLAFAHEAEVQRPLAKPHAHEEVEGHVHAWWSSHYATEGRDALDGPSLLNTTIEFGWNHLAVGLWYANSPEADYDELHLSLAATQSIGDFDFYVGYTRLEFPSDGAHDDEVGAGFEFGGLPFGLDLAFDAYYSFDADGVFFETGLGRDFVVSEALTLNLGGAFGVNQGYVSDGHDGANHLAPSIGAEYQLTDGISVIAQAAYNFAIDRDGTLPGDEQLVDFFHGAIGLQWSF